MSQSPDPNSAQNAIREAVQAMRSGDRAQARRWASMAAQIDPTSEQPWLIMASLASPQASIAYLQIALERNPASQAARRGMHWAIQRQRKAQQEARAAAISRGERVANYTASELPGVILGGTGPIAVHRPV